MSEPIKAGDLVQIVKAMPCGCHTRIGYPFVVKKILTFNQAYCTDCGALYAGITKVAETGLIGKDQFFDVRCLIKINPPPLEETEHTTLDIEVPA